MNFDDLSCCSLLSYCPELLKKAVKEVPGSRQVSDVGAEMSFVLPQESASTFRQFFASLESKYMYGTAVHMCRDSHSILESSKRKPFFQHEV